MNTKTAIKIIEALIEVKENHMFELAKGGRENSHSYESAMWEATGLKTALRILTDEGDYEDYKYLFDIKEN